MDARKIYCNNCDEFAAAVSIRVARYNTDDEYQDAIERPPALELGNNIYDCIAFNLKSIPLLSQ